MATPQEQVFPCSCVVCSLPLIYGAKFWQNRRRNEQLQVGQPSYQRGSSRSLLLANHQLRQGFMHLWAFLFVQYWWLVFPTVLNWRFSSGSGFQPNWNPCNRFSLSKNRTAPSPLFFGPFHNSANSELSLQLSIWVVIVSQYDIYVQDAVVDALSRPIVQFAIRSLFVEWLWNNTEDFAFFEATQLIVIGLQIGQREVIKHLKLHLLRIYHSVIQSQLKYLIGAKVLSSRKWGSTVW